MQLIGADQILGPLGNFSVPVGRQQLGGNRGGQHIPQGGGQPVLPGLRGTVGAPGHHVAHKRFGDRGVDPVHRHMVAVVGRPAQCQLRKIPGSHHQTAAVVGQIHQHLGAFPRLAVLIGDVAVVGVVADVGKVPLYRPGNAHTAEIGSQLPAQHGCVVLGTLGGAKAGHGHRKNIGVRALQQIHGTGGRQQGQGGIQPAGNTDDGLGRPGAPQPLGKPFGLDVQNRLAACVPLVRVGRDKRMRGNRAGQRGLPGLQ